MIEAVASFITEPESRYEKCERALVVALIAALALFGLLCAGQKLLIPDQPQSTTVSQQVSALAMLDASLARDRKNMADEAQPDAHAKKLTSDGWAQAWPYVAYISYWDHQQSCYQHAVTYNRLASTLPASALRAARLPAMRTACWGPAAGH